MRFILRSWPFPSYGDYTLMWIVNLLLNFTASFS